jgi:anti-sigma factor RsiW
MDNSHQPAVTIDDLHAYADGQLPPERLAAVEAHLRQHPEAAAQVKDYRAMNAALREAAGGLLEEAPPARLRVPAARQQHWRMAAAAAVAGVLIGTAAGWLGRGALNGDDTALASLVQRAGAAYTTYASDPAHPVEMTDAGELSAWLSSRMKMNVRIPSLAADGFSLVGGRLMIGESAPAGMLMYQNGQGRRIVLYVRNDLPADRPAHMQYRGGQTGGVIYWRDAAAAFGLAGSLSEQELRPLADHIRAGFSS